MNNDDGHIATFSKAIMSTSLAPVGHLVPLFLLELARNTYWMIFPQDIAAVRTTPMMPMAGKPRHDLKSASEDKELGPKNRPGRQAQLASAKRHHKRCHSSKGVICPAAKSSSRFPGRMNRMTAIEKQRQRTARRVK